MLLTILASWAMLLALGWALVLWPHFPDGFRFATELGPAASSAGSSTRSTCRSSRSGRSATATSRRPATSCACSSRWRRWSGFALLTASVSWLLTVYPALSRRRSLAYEITLLRDVTRADGRGGFVRAQPGSAERLFAELLSRLVAVERDLVQIPVSYYFTEHDDRFSLPRVMPWLLGMAQRGLGADVPAPTRLRAEMLCAAIDDFAHTTAEPLPRRRGGADRRPARALRARPPPDGARSVPPRTTTDRPREGHR